MEMQMKIRQRYIEKNGGLDEVFKTIESKNEYAEFLTKLNTRISWIQKRNKNK